jgi:hypothetical protein
MEAKEKARDLVTKFNHFHDTKKKEYIIYQNPTESIRCALIAVDLIIEIETNLCHDLWVEFYKKVKTEIEKL